MLRPISLLAPWLLSFSLVLSACTTLGERQKRDAADTDDGDRDGGATPKDAADSIRDAASQDAQADVGVADAGGDAPACGDQCSVNATKCGASGGLQTCVELNGCPVWTSEVPCPGKQTCSGGTCACPAAPAFCSAKGTVCGAGNDGVITCSVDEQGCVSAGEKVACPAGKSCTGAFPEATCSCPPAPAGCNGAQGTFCTQDGKVAECALDAAGCVVVKSMTTCPAGKPCSGNHPSASCSCGTPPAECAKGGGVECTGATSFNRCGVDANGCLAVTERGTCPAGKPCAGTHPNAQCTCPAAPNDCSGSGKVCRGTTLATCGPSADGCLTTTGTMSCAGPCKGTFPNAVCCPAAPTECSAPGNVCSGNTVVTCALDTNGCLVVSARNNCSGSKACTGAAPNAACACPAAPAECSGVGSVCSGNTVVTCANDASGCLVVTARTTCSGSKSCVGAAPNAACTCPAPPAECASTGNVCSGASLVTCGNDASGCLAKTATQQCPTTANGTATCANATCGVNCNQGYTKCNDGTCRTECPGITEIALDSPDDNGCATDISDNGNVIVGFSQVAGTIPFRWTRGDASLTKLKNIPGTGDAYNGMTWSVSSDGSKSIGCATNAMGLHQFVIWSGSSLPQPISAAGFSCLGTAAISGDGNVAVGSFGRKVGSGAPTSLFTSVLFIATNSDGSAAVAIDDAFTTVWWPGSPAKPLPYIGPTTLSMNGDATVVVGGAKIWRSNVGGTNLAIPAGLSTVESFDVARSAPIAVGTAYDDEAQGVPVIWNTTDNSVRILTTVLAFPNWSKLRPRAVSADGKVVAGCGMSPSGAMRIFRAVLP